jgi:hypothetical protein
VRRRKEEKCRHGSGAERGAYREQGEEQAGRERSRQGEGQTGSRERRAGRGRSIPISRICLLSFGMFDFIALLVCVEGREIERKGRGG